MSAHTPGPWSLPHFAEPAADCQCGYVLTEDRFGAVATVHASGSSDDVFAHGDNPKFAEAVANAHLIATAPVLLAALRDVVGWIPDAGPWATNEPRKALERARAAIAQATGASA